MITLNKIKSVLELLKIKKFALKLTKIYAKIHPNQIVKRNGINYSLDLNQLIDFGTFIGGWEPGTIEFLNRNLNKGDVAIEVGANVGAHTLIIAKLVGNEGHVYAFEPTKYAGDKLNKNIKLNPVIKNITIKTELVTNDENEIPKTEIRSSWSLDSRYEPEKNSELTHQNSTSIDQFISETGLTKLNLLKIDVDGYDYKVIQGAKATIQKFLPIIFCELCEYTLNEQGDSVEKIFSTLSSMNYIAHSENGTKLNDSEDVLRLIGHHSSINGIFTHSKDIV
jgi:FkbM family methyltransferase